MRTITALSCLSFSLMLSGISSCALLPTHRVTYNQDDAQIGIEDDPTISVKQTDVRNAHPAQLTVEQVQSLLAMIQVTGWSGTIIGIFVPPEPFPFISQDELQKYSRPITDALNEAGPTERVFFSFPRPGGRYSEDRTTGALFLRGRYLHFVLTDHSSVLRADTGGDNLRVGPERNTKALKLWVAKPAQPATVPDAEMPKWAPFETVHVSLNLKQALAKQSAPPAPVSREQGRTSTPVRQGSEQDLQNQIRDLSNSNTELREQLDEQKAKMKDLTDDMNRLRLELDQTKTGKPPVRKNPTP